MNKLRIVNESLPWRCDICHQADYYDANLDYCSRCAQIKADMVTRSSNIKHDPFEVFTVVGGFGGGLICALWLFISYFQTGRNLQFTHFFGTLITLVCSVSIGALSGLLFASTLNLCSYLAKSILTPLRRLLRQRNNLC